MHSSTELVPVPAPVRLTVFARIVRELVLAGLCVCVCVLIGCGLTWLGLASRASAELQAVQQGSSPVAFDFEDLGQLIGRRVEGAAAPRIVADGTELRVLQQGVNIGLNFRDRELDLRRFPDLRLVLEIDHAGSFTPIVEDRSGRRFTALQSQSLDKGLNPLRLDLARMSWTLGAAGDAAVAAGQGPGRIRTLRLYIGAPADTRIVLREARFYALDEPVVRFTLANWRDWPENWLRDADQVRSAAPETIVQPPGFPTDPSVGSQFWWLMSSIFALLICAIALVCSYLCRVGAVATRGVACWGLLAFPVLALWIGDDPAWGLLGFGLAAALVGLRRLPPPPAVRGALRAWLEAALLTVLALAGLSMLPGAHFELGLPDRPWMYLLWAFLQQLVLQRVLYARLRKNLPPGWAGWLAALGFALWHAPNLGLMLLTLLGGRAWCELYERNGRLAPLVWSHALIGVLALQWLTPELLRSAEVSARFLGLL
jgi:membrane protease YdiL (CAAX protease family)